MSAVLKNGKEISRNALIAMMAAILAPDYPGSTIVTDSVTSDELTEFLQGELGLRHLRFKRGYKNVIDECIRLNKEGTVSPLAIETSGHGALSENYYLDDGAYLAVKLLIAAAKAKAKGRQAVVRGRAPRLPEWLGPAAHEPARPADAAQHREPQERRRRRDCRESPGISQGLHEPRYERIQRLTTSYERKKAAASDGAAAFFV